VFLVSLNFNAINDVTGSSHSQTTESRLPVVKVGLSPSKDSDLEMLPGKVDLDSVSDIEALHKSMIVSHIASYNKD